MIRRGREGFQIDHYLKQARSNVEDHSPLSLLVFTLDAVVVVFFNV